MLCSIKIHANIRRIMWHFFCLYDKPQAFDLLAVLLAGRHDINARGVDAAVAQDIGQLRNVFLKAIKGSGEQLAQIVGKHFTSLHLSFVAEPLHLCPY